jgi:Holliday junction resolvase-like predicted endonuclease
MKSKGKKAEEKVKSILERGFNQKFNKQKLIVGKKSVGEPIYKEFDLVSEDGSIIVEVKSYKYGNNTTKSAGYTSTRKWRLIGACFYLNKAKPKNRKTKIKKRILVLTNKKLHDIFTHDMDGLIDKRKIEIKFFSV